MQDGFGCARLFYHLCRGAPTGTMLQKLIQIPLSWLLSPSVNFRNKPYSIFSTSIVPFWGVPHLETMTHVKSVLRCCKYTSQRPYPAKRAYFIGYQKSPSMSSYGFSNRSHFVFANFYVCFIIYNSVGSLLIHHFPCRHQTRKTFLLSKSFTTLKTFQDRRRGAQFALGEEPPALLSYSFEELLPQHCSQILTTGH